MSQRRRSSEFSSCRDCGRTIRWARGVESGKPVALDPSPVEGGTVELFQGNATIVPPGRGALHELHYRSCPARAREYA